MQAAQPPQPPSDRKPLDRDPPATVTRLSRARCGCSTRPPRCVKGVEPRARPPTSARGSSIAKTVDVDGAHGRCVRSRSSSAGPSTSSRRTARTGRAQVRGAHGEHQAGRGPGRAIAPDGLDAAAAGPRPVRRRRPSASASTTCCTQPRSTGATRFDSHPFHDSTRSTTPPVRRRLGDPPIASYAVPGLGGRQPVAYVGPTPSPPCRRRAVQARRPVVAILDTGCGKHPWLDDVVTKDVKLDGEHDRLPRRRPPTPRSPATSPARSTA